MRGVQRTLHPASACCCDPPATSRGEYEQHAAGDDQTSRHEVDLVRLVRECEEVNWLSNQRRKVCAGQVTNTRQAMAYRTHQLLDSGVWCLLLQHTQCEYSMKQHMALLQLQQAVAASAPSSTHMLKRLATRPPQPASRQVGQMDRW